MLQIDHLMWTAPDLTNGSRAIAALCGSEPVPGGSHPGRGTRNALLGFARQQYLEVLAPDPAQDLTGTQGAELARQSAGHLATFCCRGRPLAEIAAEARDLGLTVSGPVDYQRQRPDGVLLAWQLLFLGGHPYAGLVPFFIDWQDSPHPAADAGSDISLRALTACTPAPDRLQHICSTLGIPLVVTAGASPSLEARLQLPTGEVLLG